MKKEKGCACYGDNTIHPCWCISKQAIDKKIKNRKAENCEKE